MLRYGYHKMPTALVLTFSQALDPTTAEDAKNYRIIGPHGQVIRVKWAVYDPTTQTVTLDPRERISIHHQYKLIVDGFTAGGVTNTNGQLLDGAGSGKPGSNYRASAHRAQPRARGCVAAVLGQVPHHQAQNELAGDEPHCAQSGTHQFESTQDGRTLGSFGRS